MSDDPGAPPSAGPPDPAMLPPGTRRGGDGTLYLTPEEKARRRATRLIHLEAVMNETVESFSATFAEDGAARAEHVERVLDVLLRKGLRNPCTAEREPQALRQAAGGVPRRKMRMTTTLWEAGLCDAEYSAVGEADEDDDHERHPEWMLINRLGVLMAAALVEELQRQAHG